MSKRGKSSVPLGLTQAVYAERANRHNILRKLEQRRTEFIASAKLTVEHKHDCIAEAMLMLDTVEELPPTLAHTKFLKIREYRKSIVKNQYDLTILAHQDMHEAFDKKTKTLKVFGEVGSLVVVDNLVSIQQQSYNIESELCPNCGEMFSFNHVTYMKTCNICSFTINSIFVTEDTSQDTIAAKRFLKTSSSITFEPENVQRVQHGRFGCVQEDTTIPPLDISVVSHRAPPRVHVDVVNPENTSIPDSINVRVQQYRRWLQQFLDTRPPTPQAVMEMLYNQLSFMHVVSSVKCRPTPVSNILRQHGFKDYAADAVRISREFNGSTIPILTSVMLEKMVQRFTVLATFEIQHPQKKKLYTFEFLTVLVCWAEGREDIASLVCLQKTRSILKFCDYRIRDILRTVANDHRYPDLDWSLLTAMV